MFNPQPHPIKADKKPKSRIKPVSKGRAKELKTYGQKRKEFLEAHPACQAKLIRCHGKSIEVHHAAGRTGKKLNDEKLFIALCRSCHDQIHNKLAAKDLRDKGLKK